MIYITSYLHEPLISVCIWIRAFSKEFWLFTGGHGVRAVLLSLFDLVFIHFLIFQSIFNMVDLFSCSVPTLNYHENIKCCFSRVTV